MIRTIPLRPGAPFQRFRVDLSGTMATIRLYWSTRFGLYCVDILDGDKPITLGRALHPGMDLLAGLNLGIGSLYLEGAEATIGNLGVDNRLRYAT